jgi:hypothetical protein
MKPPSTTAARSGTLQTCPRQDAPTSPMWRRCFMRGPTRNAPLVRVSSSTRSQNFQRETTGSASLPHCCATRPHACSVGADLTRDRSRGGVLRLLMCPLGLPQTPVLRPSPPGTPAALLYLILRRLSSTSRARAGTGLRRALGRLPAAAIADSGLWRPAIAAPWPAGC